MTDPSALRLGHNGETIPEAQNPLRITTGSTSRIQRADQREENSIMQRSPIRSLLLVLFASATLFAAPMANALTTFNVTTDRGNGGDITLFPGDLITIDIRLSGGTNVSGLGASAWGYDPLVLEFVSGQAVGSINHLVAVPGVGYFAGMQNSIVPPAPEGTVGSGPLSESSVGAHGNRVLFMSGVSLVGSNSNPLDPGLDGSATDAQFRLVFQSARAGMTVVNIGTGYFGDGEFLTGSLGDQSANVQLRFSVIPEPGTALLMSLGLAILASGRFSRRSLAR